MYSYDYFETPLDEDIYKSFNRYKLQKNFVSLNDDENKNYITKDCNLNDKLDQKEKRLFSDTMYLQVFMIGTIGFLYMMPSSFTNWEENDDTSLDAKWKEHVKAGPVWDKDDFAINYIGHPVSGAWYYMVAREDGFGPWGSFAYSFVLSTFFWEYGYEAFAEIPSTQDLIFTPTIGAIMGEGFWYLQNELDKNHGIIWGSPTLGDVAYFLLNPIGRITESLDNFFDIYLEFHYQVYQPPTLSQVSPYLRKIDYVPSTYGFMLEINF